MKNTKQILAGILALTMTGALTACSGDDEGTGGNGGNDETTTQATTTTTQATVEKNTETLAQEEADSLADALAQLKDEELANKEIKFLAHYDINPSGNGASKKVELELFERKYGGSVKWYETTYENRWNDLSNHVLGGTGIDFYVSDTTNLPKGIASSMFQPVDDYIDINDAIWQNTAAAMDCYKFGGKHYMFVTNTRANYYVYYNTETIESNGFEDPWELYKAGEWNWDKFKEMLSEWVDVDNDQYGLDNWFNELALLYSAGVAPVSTDESGKLICNLSDPTIEQAMNYQKELYDSGLIMDLAEFNWTPQWSMMGDGRQLFMICGYWEAEGDPSVWTNKIPAENLGFVPTPSPAGSDPWQAATLEGYVLCKGATNPEGVARFAECTITAVNDPNAIAIADRKTMEDNHWSQELIDKQKEINQLAKDYPVVDLAPGVSTDVNDALYATAESCMKAAFHGTDWATSRETYENPINTAIDEMNVDLAAATAE